MTAVDTTSSKLPVELREKIWQFVEQVASGQLHVGFVTFWERLCQEVERFARCHGGASYSSLRRTLLSEYGRLGAAARPWGTNEMFYRTMRAAHYLLLSTMVEFRAAQPGTRADTLVVLCSGMGSTGWLCPTFCTRFEGSQAEFGGHVDRLWLSDAKLCYFTMHAPSFFMREQIRLVAANYKRVLGLGVSAGATVALMNADLCTHVLAFAPQTNPKRFHLEQRHVPQPSPPPTVKPAGVRSGTDERPCAGSNRAGASKPIDDAMAEPCPYAELFQGLHRAYHDPTRSRWDTPAFGGNFERQLVQNVRCNSQCEITIYVGTVEKDLVEIECVRDIDHVRVIETPYDTHSVWSRLKDDGLLDKILSNFVLEKHPIASCIDLNEECACCTTTKKKPPLIL